MTLTFSSGLRVVCEANHHYACHTKAQKPKFQAIINQGVVYYSQHGRTYRISISCIVVCMGILMLLDPRQHKCYFE